MKKKLPLIPFLNIIITNNCISSCKHCNVWKPKRCVQDAPVEKFIEFYKSVSKWFKPVHIFITGGEPLLYKDLDKLLEFGKKKNFIQTVTTNGYLINEENAEFLSQTCKNVVTVKRLSVLARQRHRAQTKTGKYPAPGDYRSWTVWRQR